MTRRDHMASRVDRGVGGADQNDGTHPGDRRVDGPKRCRVDALALIASSRHHHHDRLVGQNIGQHGQRPGQVVRTALRTRVVEGKSQTALGRSP